MAELLFNSNFSMTNNRGVMLPAKSFLLPLLMLGFVAACLAALDLSRLLYPLDSGQYEGGIWMPAQFLVAGHNPYARNLGEQPPYLMAPYGPAYYAVIGLGMRLGGEAFWFGRALSDVAGIVCAGCIALLTRRFNPMPSQSANAKSPADSDVWWLGAALFLASLPVQLWSGIQRPDFLALALSLLGLTLALALERPGDKAGWSARFGRDLGAALLLSLAVLCRQTAVLPIIMVCLWHATQQRPKRALRFALLAGVPLLIVFMALNVSSDGGFWWQNVTLAASVSKSWSRVAGFLTLMACSPATITTALLCVAGLRQIGEPRRTVEGSDAIYRLLWIYLALAMGLAMVTSSRNGANLNYFLETCAVSSIVAPLSWRRLRLAGRVSSKMLRLGCVVLATSAGATSVPVGLEESSRWQSLSYLQAVSGAVQQLTRPDEPSFSAFPELITQAGRRYEFNDWVQYDGRSPRLQRVFEQRLHSQQLGAIILLPDQKAPPGFQLARPPGPLPPKFVLLYVRSRFSPAQIRRAFQPVQPKNDFSPNK